MAIKNKDGSSFQVYSKPNPIMTEQDIWDDGSKFVLHNFIHEEFVLHNFEHQEETSYEQEEDEVEEFQRLEDIEPIEIKVPIKETPVPPGTKKPKGAEKVKKEDAILIYCLPANVIEVEDSIYGERRTSLTYGQQFTFQGVIRNQTDLSVQIWTNVAVDMGKRSILYIPTQRRWWSLDDSSPVTNGKILICSPSATQPSFST